MTTSAARPTIIKVGGSLLDWPDLPGRLSPILAARAKGPIFLLAGGGPAADWIRAVDAKHHLGQERAHWLALHALDLNAHVLAQVVPNTHVITCISETASVWSTGRTPILAPYRFMEEDDRRDDRLPHNWHVTSDAIAARLAVRVDAAELILVKSCSVPPGTTRARAAELELVDPVFPLAASPLACVLVRNLRDPAGTEVPLVS